MTIGDYGSPQNKFYLDYMDQLAKTKIGKKVKNPPREEDYKKYFPSDPTKSKNTGRLISEILMFLSRMKPADIIDSVGEVEESGTENLYKQLVGS